VIEFGPQLISPSYHRDPWFSGSETSDRLYSWQCVLCRADVHVPLEAILREAWSWKSNLGHELAAAATAHFALNAVGKSHDGGWPSVLLARCASCGAHYLLYAGVREPSNSVYRVVMQGLSEVRGLTRRCT
jgi:hypothetical protein